MALNFSRCVAIFGISWSEARLPNITFSPSPLVGCFVALEVGTPGPPPAKVPGEPAWGHGCHGARHQVHCRHGCQRRRTATTKRAPALVSVPGSASAREQERRAAASNIPDSVSYFVSPNGPTTGPRRAPAIAQASHNFMERRLPGGIPDFPFRRPRGRPMYDNAVFWQRLDVHSTSRTKDPVACLRQRGSGKVHIGKACRGLA